MHRKTQKSQTFGKDLLTFYQLFHFGTASTWTVALSCGNHVFFEELALGSQAEQTDPRNGSAVIDCNALAVELLPTLPISLRIMILGFISDFSRNLREIAVHRL
jgi:hypothetical protein